MSDWEKSQPYRLGKIYKQFGEMLMDELKDKIECLITLNPCGTDTRPCMEPCPCATCVCMRRIEELAEQRDRLARVADAAANWIAKQPENRIGRMHQIEAINKALASLDKGKE